MALNTWAPLAQPASVSRPDVSKPTSRPLKSAFNGLVQSIRTFPLRPPQDSLAVLVAPQGAQTATISDAAAAWALVATRTRLFFDRNTAARSSEGSLRPKRTWCPRFAYPNPSA